jgi:hypothetical protein
LTSSTNNEIAGSEQIGLLQVVSVSAGTPYQSTPELDMISKDIAELAVEKRTLESDIAQREADIKIKSGEIKSLQVRVLFRKLSQHS